MWLLWASGMWYRARVLNPSREKIAACTHETGRVIHVRTDRYGRDRAAFLVWQCDSCPLQSHLRELVPTVWDDTFFYLRSGREAFGVEHARVLNAQRSILRDEPVEDAPEGTDDPDPERDGS